jgi:hypothetical protein
MERDAQPVTINAASSSGIRCQAVFGNNFMVNPRCCCRAIARHDAGLF